MSVTHENSRTSHVGNGVETVYALGLDYILKSDIEVRVNGVTKATPADYTITESGAANVVFVAPPPDAQAILFLREQMFYTQLEDFPGNGPIYPERHEQCLDRLVMLCQQLERRIAALEAP
jgi:hypothetical protein